MTADGTTEAARAEAEDYARTPRMNVGTVRDRITEAHLAGAAWGREQALTEEPTDAEVEAAARTICEGTEAGDLTVWGPETQRRFRNTARAALAAARAARRDEEKR